MNPDDLDRILLSEKPIHPSSSFAEDVLARIRAGSLRSRPASFQWICFGAFMLVLALAAAWVFPSESAVRELHALSYSIGRWMLSAAETAMPHSLRLVLDALIGTMLLVWLSLRLALGTSGR
jgi:hypothetical protein